MKLRNLSISGKLKDNMYTEGCPIDDHIPYHGLQEILKDSLLKSDNKEIIFLIFRLQQALSQISERLMHDQTLQDTVGSIESWINHLESEKNTLQSMVKIV